MRSSVKALLFILCISCAFHTYGQVAANFTVSSTNGCAPFVASFTNTSTNASSYSWNLGNGNTSLFQNASSSYLSPGTYTITLTAFGSGGTSSTKSIQITVHVPPAISFSATDTAVCKGVAVTFNNTTNLISAGTGTYSWSFGDGNTATVQNPSHTYAAPGYYSVTLTATNSDSCSASLVVNSYIHVLPSPVPQFTTSDSILCGTPAHVTFTDQSTGNGTLSHTWNFGDNTAISTSTDPAHNYLIPGSFNVEEIVTDIHGCKDSLTVANDVVVQNLVAAMNVPDTACASQSILFQNISAGNSVTSYWLFGDGGTDYNLNTTHIYNSGGTHIIKLVAYSGNCTDTASKQIYIRPVPTASFTFTPGHPCPAPINVQFTSTAPAGATYAWNFGDGGTSAIANPLHTYNIDSFLPVSMAITSQGCTFIIIDTVKIYNIFMTIDSPHNQAAGCPPATLTFQVEAMASTICCNQLPASYSYPYSVTSYFYDFGDGGPTSAQPTAHHTYTAPGLYHTTYTLTTANGCTVTDTSSIGIGSPPVLDSVIAAPLHVCRDRPVYFYAYGHGMQPLEYLYAFVSTPSSCNECDAGINDSTDHHTYSSPGVYQSFVTVSNYGCPSPDTTKFTVIVDSPGAAIAPTQIKPPCDSPLTVRAHSISLGATSLEWLFGDGNTSTASGIVHSYAAPGQYTLQLTTYNSASGCRDTALQVVNILDFRPKILVADTAICKYGYLHFTASYNMPNLAPSSQIWYVNGYALDTPAQITYQFDTVGLYSIMLVDNDINNCYDSAFQKILVAQPIANITATPTQVCVPGGVLFTDSSFYISGTYAVSHTWLFGDGATVNTSSTTASHLYSSPGSFYVKEVVTDNLGCQDSIYHLNYINAHKPIANFSVANPNRCAGDTITFISTGTPPKAMHWTFGDGTSSAASTPVHSYSASGNYTVTLAITDSAGCRDTLVRTAYIGISKPHAAFSENNGSGVCLPLIVQFHNLSVNGATYAWSFGNSNTSFATNPSNSYTAQGNYNVQLITADTHGCKDTAYGHVTLYGYSGAFSYNPLYGCPPLSVNFAASITNIPSITWDFSDGTVTNPSALTTTTHIYTAPGKYVPKLILTDSAGCHTSSYGTDTIRVDRVHTGFVATGSVCIYDTLHFTDTSSGLFSPVSSWQWFLGDGATSSYQNPIHNYLSAGSFPVMLIATDAAGCKDTAVSTVIIHPLPTISAIGDTTICPGDSALVNAGGAVTYMWDPVATIACPTCNPTFVVPVMAGNYIVSGTDAFGCKNTDSVAIGFTYKTVSYAGGGGQICIGQSITLTDSGAQSYSWYPAAALSDSHIADPIASPVYSIAYLAIAQTASCIPDTNQVNVIVNPLPTVTATGSTTVIAGATVNLQAYGPNIVSFLWNHEDLLNCSTCTHPVATMQQTTRFTVTATNQYGCQDSASVVVDVLCDKSQVFIPNTFTPNGDGQNDVFYPRGIGIKVVKSFRIYNRWGELVFERDNINLNDESSGWDGTFKGAKPVPDTYIYALDAVCDNDEPMDWKGDVTLIK